jgi:2-polyprenyl-6-methoxyphenol hydroxylase-like FAD-dependent oxidoreductase
MLLARNGHRVLSVDRASFPSDTLSTHFLPPRTTALLSQWGLLDRLTATGCPLIESITLDFGPVKIRGQPDAVAGTSAMFCPRRRILDHLLVSAAREAGAEIRERTTVREVIWRNQRVCGIRAADANGHESEHEAAIVVGADGLWSRVAREVGARPEMQHASLSCAYYAYWSKVPTDGVEFYRRAGKVILVFPTHDDLACIYVGLPIGETSAYRADIRSTYLATLEVAPSLAARVKLGHQVESFRGTNKLPNFYRQSWGDGWALVGDAAYHRDPITGMGISDAFLGAQLLADALDAGLDGSRQLDEALMDYQTEFRRRTRDVFEYTLKSAELLDPEPLMDLYSAVGQDRDATRQMMNVVVGTSSFRSLFNSATISRLTSQHSI